MSSYFQYDGMDLNKLESIYGTPLFIFNRKEYISGILKFKEIWKRQFPEGNIYLSYKTNYLPEVCKIANQLGFGADVVSGYELFHALKLCTDKHKIVFNGRATA